MSQPAVVDELFTPDAVDPFLSMPISGLIDRQNSLLREPDWLQRASRMGMYMDAWKKSGIKPEQITNRKSLTDLPYFDEDGLAEVFITRKSINASLIGKPRVWLMESTHSGKKKWLPMSTQDIRKWCAAIRRADRVLFPEADRPHRQALVMNRPMPHASNPLPYLWEQMDVLVNGGKLEWIVGAASMLPRVHWHEFALKKQPQLFMASVEDAFTLADLLKNSPGLRRLEKGIFWGAPLDGEKGAREMLQSAYALPETFSLYLSLECREMFVECQAHAGIHAWMDNCIAEILPDGQEKALFLDQTPAGLRGELILTTFSDVLPLIRYRTGERIEVIGSEPCACGATAPRFLWIGKVE